MEEKEIQTTQKAPKGKGQREERASMEKELLVRETSKLEEE